MNPDPVMAEIMGAAGPLQSGDRVGARTGLEAVWARLGADALPIHKVALAHYLADAQDDPAQELAWDLTALEAASLCTDDDVQAKSQLQAVAGMMPSLHANLAEDYLKLGDAARSRVHLEEARKVVGQLADDPYGQLIRRGIERIAAMLAAAET